MLDSVKNREAFNKKNQQEIKNIEEIEKENNQKDKVKENELYQKLCNYFEVNNIEAIKKEISLLSEEAIYRHQIDKLVKQFFLSALSKGDIFAANYFKELPFYSSEGIDNDKLKWAIKYCARFIIERGLKSEEVSLLKKLGISETDWKDAAILALPQIMSKGDFEFIDKIIKKYNLSSQEVANEAKVAILNMIYDNSDFLEKESDNDNKETKEIYVFDIGLAYDLADKYNSQMKIEIKKTLINNLNNEYFSFLNDLLDIKQIDSFNQFKKDQEIQTAAKKAICQLLENYSFDSEKNINVRESILIIKNNILSSENSNSPDVLDAVIKCVINLFSNNKIDDVLKIQKIFSLKEEIIINILQKSISKLLSKGNENDFNYAIQIKEIFDLSEKLNNNEINQAVSQAIIKTLSKGNIDKALEIKDEFNLPDEFLNSSEVQQAAQEGMINRLSYGDIDRVLEIKNKFNLSDEFLNSYKVQQAAQEGMINRLSYGDVNKVFKIKNEFNLSEVILPEIAKKSLIIVLSDGDIDKALEIKDEFNLPDEFFNSSEVQQAAQEGMINRLSYGDINKALQIKNNFNLSESLIIQAAQEGMIKMLKALNIHKAFKIKYSFNLPDEFLNSLEVQKLAQELMIDRLSFGDIYNVFKIKDKFNLPDEFLNSYKVQQAAQEGMINRLSYGDIDRVLEIKNKFNLPDEFLNSYKVQQVAQEGVTNRLSYGDIDKAIIIKEEFNLSEEVLIKLAQEVMIDELLIGDISTAIRIKDNFNFSNDFINSYKIKKETKKRIVKKLLDLEDINSIFFIKEEFNLSESLIIQVAKEVILNKLSDGNINKVLKIKESFNLPDEFLNSSEVKQAAKQGMIKELLNGHRYIDDTLKIKNEFNLPETIVIEATQEALIRVLSSGNINKVLKIKESFNLPDEFLNSSEVQQAAKQGIANRLLNGNIDSALKIKESFNLPDEFLNSSEVQQAAKQGMINKLLDGCINSAFEIKNKFNLPDEFLNSFEVQQATQEITIKMLLNGYIDIVIQIKDDFNLSDNFFNSYKVQQAAQEGIIHELLDDNINNAVLIKEEFNLPETTVIKAAKQVMINKLLDGFINSAFEIKNKFNLPDEFLNSFEVQQAVKQGMIKTLVNGDVNNALKIKEKLNLPETILIEAAKQGMIKALMKGNIDSVFKIKKSFNLQETILIEAAKQGMIRLLSNGDINNALAIKKEFNLPDEFINSLEVQRVVINFLDANLLELDIDSILLIINSFKLPKHYINNIISNNTLEFIEANKYEVIIQIRKELKLSPDKALNTSLDIFGNFITPEIYQDIKILLEVKGIEDIPKNLKSLGIKKVGDAGIPKLKEIISDFRNKLKNPNYHGDNLENPIFESFLKECVRYKVSQWGDHDDINFKNVIATHRDFYFNGKIKELDERYQPSKILNIAKKKMDNNEGKQFEYSEQFKIRYDILRKSIIEAYKLFEASKFKKLEVEQKGPLNSLFTEFNEIKAKLIIELEEKLIKIKHNPNIKLEVIDNLSKKIDFLKETNFRSIKNFEDNFTKLSEYKEFNELLRKLVFYLAFHSHQIKINEELINNAKLNKEPSINELAWTLEFINHITNQETRDKYFNNNLAKKAFIKLTNARALEEEYTRFQDFFQVFCGKVGMQFIPTRGLLMEFSGHIADACWASKESCLARNHPNKLALIMVQNPNSIKEKLVGSCILIETKSNKGEPLLIIRGLNPIENVINELLVKDFYQKITDYLKEIANSLGRKLAIVVDDHQGGSGSNRSAVYNFLSENCKKNKVILASFKDSDFNGYNIVNNCYLVE